MNKEKTLRACSAAIKLLSILLTLAGAVDFKFGALIFALGSIGKELFQVIGDFADDGKLNKSFVGMLAMGALLLSGCAVTRTSQTATPDGSATTRTLTLSIWDAKGVLNNFRASQSAKTQTTSLGNTSAESTSSNLVTITGNAVDLARILKP